MPKVVKNGKPTSAWLKKANAVYRGFRGDRAEGILRADVAEVFYREGFTATQTGKLCAAMGDSYDDGDKLPGFKKHYGV